jgi:predicted metal-dependent peptidase
MGVTDNKLAAGRLIAIRKCPYLTSMIMMMVPTECKGLGTIGITKNLILIYDPLFIDKCTDDEMGGLMFHEIMHPLLFHFDRRGDRNPYLWNVAGDLFINDQAKGHGFALPKGGLYPETFGFEKNLSADEYYALLVKKGEEEAKGEADKVQGEGSWKSGQCGSGAGNPMENEPEDSEVGDAGGRSDTEINQGRINVAEAVKQHVQQKGRGNMPCGLDRWADAVTKPAKVPWQSLLARFIRRAVTHRQGMVDYSYQKVARRQGAVGFGVGAPVLPAYTKPIPRVTFVLDTSGSMSRDQLELGLAEAIGVLKATGAEITFMSCDAQVHAVGKVDRASQFAKLVKGGGGSSFIPAFEAIAKLRPRTQIAIFATDGDIGVPAECPVGMQVVWLVVGADRAPTESYGQTIIVE